MKRHLLFVLMIATGAVPAGDEAGGEPPAKSDAATPRKEEATAEGEKGAEEAASEKPEGEEPQAGADQGPKRISGMSILGNQETPKSLVIVPWKSSEIGEAIGISAMLDDSRQPVDREVFMRALRYYEIRLEKTP